MKALPVLIALLFAAASSSAAEDYSKIPTEHLIDALVTLDHSSLGIDDTGDYDAFIADDASPRLVAGLLPLRKPDIPPQMREIVRRGAAALPILIAHLTDDRTTKLQVGLDWDEGFGGQFYADEYDPRIGVPCVPFTCDADNENNWYIQMPCGEECPVFHGKYTVTVGDVCEVLVGQIVNRRLSAVRYQPTNILYVNSPVKQPSLATQIRKDWGQVDSAGLEAALLDDLRTHPERFVDGALRRLRFYYPGTYAALAGDDKRKRDIFEEEEKEEHKAP